MNRILIVFVAVAVAGGLVACGESHDDDPQYRGVCVAPNTQVYLDPSQCGADGSDSSSAVWDYILLTTFMNNMNSNPGYYNAGQTVTHVVHHLPANSTSSVEYSAPKGRQPYFRRVNAGTSGKVTKAVPMMKPKPAKAPDYGTAPKPAKAPANGTAPKPAKAPAYGTPPKAPAYKSGKCC